MVAGSRKRESWSKRCNHPCHTPSKLPLLSILHLPTEYLAKIHNFSMIQSPSNYTRLIEEHNTPLLSPPKTHAHLFMPNVFSLSLCVGNVLQFQHFWKVQDQHLWDSKQTDSCEALQFFKQYLKILLKFPDIECQRINIPFTKEKNRKKDQNKTGTQQGKYWIPQFSCAVHGGKLWQDMSSKGLTQPYSYSISSYIITEKFALCLWLSSADFLHL